MSVGTAKTVEMCGRRIKLGDRLRVRYTSGERMKGSIIEGAVVKLWDEHHPPGHFKQGLLSCGWAFHDWDEIVSITSREVV